jgi:hypothetical protein
MSAVTPEASAASWSRREAVSPSRGTSPTTPQGRDGAGPPPRGEYLGIAKRLGVDDPVGMQADAGKRRRKQVAAAQAPQHGPFETR